MSGFFSVFHIDSTPIDLAIPEAMQQRIAYLGEDAHTLTINEPKTAVFGCALQRVTDESVAETQPITRDNLTLLANARLDARDVLIGELRAVGGQAADGLHNPHHIPDSDLILRTYQVWGEACVTHLLGDFAFVIWDAAAKRVFAARDPLGVQPFYYAFKTDPALGRVLVCANELLAVKLHPAVSATLDESVIGDFLLFGSHKWIDAARTVYADIRTLPPAHSLTADMDGLTLRQYWTMPIGEPLIHYRTEAGYIQRYRELLKTAIQDRMHTDRLVIWMSGGLDSSALAALALELVREGKVNTHVSAIVGVYDRIHPDTEAYYAGIIARKLNMPLEILPLDQFTIREPLPVSAQPSQNYQRGHNEHMQETAARLGRLNFSGFGSDESLRESALWDVLRRMPPPQAIRFYLWLWRFLGHRPGLTGLLPALCKAFDPRTRAAAAENNGSYRYPKWLNPDFEARFDLPARWNQYWNHQPSVNVPYQPEAYKGIAHNIWETAREPAAPLAFTPTLTALPYIDLRLLTFLVSIPPQPFNHRKAILRRAMAGSLPEETIKRPKVPLGFLTWSMLRLPGTEWLDTWQPIPELAAYVRRDAVPPVSGEHAPENMATVHLRPIALNAWLQYYLANIRT